MSWSGHRCCGKRIRLYPLVAPFPGVKTATRGIRSIFGPLKHFECAVRATQATSGEGGQVRFLRVYAPAEPITRIVIAALIAAIAVIRITMVKIVVISSDRRRNVMLPATFHKCKPAERACLCAETDRHIPHLEVCRHTVIKVLLSPVKGVVVLLHGGPQQQGDDVDPQVL